MNIRISIKDCDSHSQVDQKKKSMLYAPPERDGSRPPDHRNTKKIQSSKLPDPKTTVRETPAYRESEKQML